jgi:chorismate dehydratase
LAVETSNTARLLIGDKVVCEEPAGFPYQIDLGEAWKQMTGLPFVFAAWMARDGVDIGTLADDLDRAKRSGLKRVDELIERYALPRGWPAGIAHRYLTEFLQYDIGPRQIEAIRLFHRLAYEHGILEQSPRELVVEK